MKSSNLNTLQAIGRWKSKVKAKALNLKLEMKQTGGGPVKSPPLNDVEERLINLLGWKSITGDKNKEIGLVRLNFLFKILFFYTN